MISVLFSLFDFLKRMNLVVCFVFFLEPNLKNKNIFLPILEYVSSEIKKKVNYISCFLLFKRQTKKLSKHRRKKAFEEAEIYSRADLIFCARRNENVNEMLNRCGR